MVWLAPPPRAMPLSLRIIHTLGSQLAWIVFGFTTVFFWQFVMKADLSFLTFRGPFRFAAARITDVKDTGARESKIRIFANYYEYSVEGQPLTGISYSRLHGARVGDTVVVEYKEADPADSRIEGMRRRVFGPGAIALIFLPVGGAVWLIWSIRKGMLRRRLLEHGRIGTGTLIEKRATNVRVNKKTVWELTFEFTSSEGRTRVAKIRTHEPERLQDEKAEPVLYDPYDPSAVYLLDELPSRPEINSMGQLQDRPRAAALSMILPAVVVLGNLIALLT